MRELCRISILVFGIVALFPSLSTSAEEDVLQALENVKVGIEDGVSYEKGGRILGRSQESS